MDLFGLLDEPSDSITNDEVDGGFLGVKAPWVHIPNANYMEDWDHDGIPNYADHWFGPGAYLPQECNSLGSLWEEIDQENFSALENIENTSDLFHFTEKIGDYEEDAFYWHLQKESTSCAIVAQQGILNSLGVDVDEDQLIQIATEEGFFDPTIGTRPDDVGKLLELAGVPVIRKYNCTLNDLADWLERGEKVIVGLNANEVWQPLYDSNGAPVDQICEGHAVWVTGIEVDGKDTFVILNDSGNQNGQMSKVRLEDFENAWSDFGSFATTTQLGG